MGPIYLVTAVGLGGAFVYRALRLWQTGDPARSWGLFKFSIWYLAALFAAVAVDAVIPVSRACAEVDPEDASTWSTARETSCASVAPRICQRIVPPGSTT